MISTMAKRWRKTMAKNDGEKRWRKAKQWSPYYRTKMMTTSCRTTRPEGGERTMTSKTYQGKQLVVIT